MKRTFTFAAVFAFALFLSLLSMSYRAMADELINTEAGESAAQSKKTERLFREDSYKETPTAENPRKQVAITFDDGPGQYTGELLDELRNRNVKATFFIFAKRLTPENAHLLRQMDEDGHCIGSHTYSHLRLTKLNDAQIHQEVSKADAAIAEIIGYTPNLIRPPYGSYNKRVVEACGKPVILWSVDTRDWQIHESETVCKNILDSVKDGDVILLHELEASSKDGVIAAIDIMLEDGYSFVTVPELFEGRGITLVSGKHYRNACLQADKPAETGK